MHNVCTIHAKRKLLQCVMSEEYFTTAQLLGICFKSQEQTGHRAKRKNNYHHHCVFGTKKKLQAWSLEKHICLSFAPSYAATEIQNVAQLCFITVALIKMVFVFVMKNGIWSKEKWEKFAIQSWVKEIISRQEGRKEGK